MAQNQDMRISVPSASRRETFQGLAGWRTVFSEEQICEILHRYCNTQDGAKKYRANAATRLKLLKKLAEESGLMAEVEARLEDEG